MNCHSDPAERERNLLFRNVRDSRFLPPKSGARNDNAKTSLLQRQASCHAGHDCPLHTTSPPRNSASKSHVINRRSIGHDCAFHPDPAQAAEVKQTWPKRNHSIQGLTSPYASSFRDLSAPPSP